MLLCPRSILLLDLLLRQKMQNLFTWKARRGLGAEIPLCCSQESGSRARDAQLLKAAPHVPLGRGARKGQSTKGRSGTEWL